MKSRFDHSSRTLQGTQSGPLPAGTAQKGHVESREKYGAIHRCRGGSRVRLGQLGGMNGTMATLMRMPANFMSKG